MIEIPKQARWKIVAILTATAAFAVFLYQVWPESDHREGFRIISKGSTKGQDATSRRNAIATYVAHGLMDNKLINAAWGGNATHPSTFLWKEAPVLKIIEIGQQNYKSKFEKEFNHIYSELKLEEGDEKINYLVLIENGSHEKIRKDGDSSILNQVPFSEAKKRTLINGINNSRNSDSSGCAAIYDANKSGFATLAFIAIDPSELLVDIDDCVYRQVLKSAGFFKKIELKDKTTERKIDRFAVSVLYSFAGDDEPFQAISPTTVKERAIDLLERRP